MVTKKKIEPKKSFLQEYRKTIIIGFIMAFVAAFGGWTFSSVRGSLASLDQQYDNKVLEKMVATKEEVAKQVKDLIQKVEHDDQLIAQQSVKTFEMYQQKLDLQTKESQRQADMNKLEDYRRQKILIEKELVRDPRNQYLKDQLDSLKRQIQMLEEKYLYK